MSINLLRASTRFARSAGFGARIFPRRTLGRRPGPRVVFLPARGREGAALLRIYNVAAVLQGMGRDVYVLPWRFTLAQRRRWLAALSPDVIVMQGTRHPLNRPALYPDQRIVLDLDDADFHLGHLAASVREAMAHTAGVMAGSEYIADWCRRAGARSVHVVWTGAPTSRDPRKAQNMRGPIVAWAQTRPMNYVHEVALVRAVMRRVAKRHPGTVLRLYDRHAGDSAAFAQDFASPGLMVQWHRRTDYRTFLDSLDDVAVGLAPLISADPFCRAKSFGKLLAYLDRQVPVVASDYGEPRAFFTGQTGRLCRTEDDWVEAVLQLLSDAAARQRQADAGLEAFRNRLSTEVTAAHVWEVLEGISRPSEQAVAGCFSA